MQNQIKHQNINEAQKRITIVIKFSRLLKVPEAAEFLNMDESSMHLLITKGEIPLKRINGESVISEIDLWDWMYNQNPELDIFANSEV